MIIFWLKVFIKPTSNYILHFICVVRKKWLQWKLKIKKRIKNNKSKFQLQDKILGTKNCSSPINLLLKYIIILNQIF